jgi:hypothetical protein
LNTLRDVWLPAADQEFEVLIGRTRNIGADTGDLFCVFEKAVRKGAQELGPPSDVCGSAGLYIRYEGRVMMCFAVCGKQIAIVKWAEMGSEAQQRRELEEARTRAAQLFP